MLFVGQRPRPPVLILAPAPPSDSLSLHLLINRKKCTMGALKLPQLSKECSSIGSEGEPLPFFALLIQRWELAETGTIDKMQGQA